MDLTVLGKSNSWPDAGGACSGYLLTEGEFRLLLDCGTGTLANLRRYCAYAEVDAIVISHLHADHVIDLVPYSSALCYTEQRPSSRVRLYGPPGLRLMLSRLAAALGLGDVFDLAFEIVEYEPSAPLALGPLRLRFCEVPHFVQTFAIELTSADGRRFTYGADCRYNRALIEFAADTDLLLVEATLGAGPDPDGPPEDGEGVVGEGHMTALQAGRLGRAARAQRVLISHFSDECDVEGISRCAARGFEGEIELAREDLRLTV